MGVSENSGTPKSSILMGFSIINHPFWGTSIFGNIHIYVYNCLYIYPKLCMVHKKHLWQQWHVATVALRNGATTLQWLKQPKPGPDAKNPHESEAPCLCVFLELSTKHVVFLIIVALPN